MVSGIFACTPHLSPPYSQAMVDKVKLGMNTNTQVYSFIKEQDDKTYAPYTSNYDNVESMMVDISRIDSSRVKPGKLLFIDNAIFNRFLAYRKVHEVNNNITNAMLDVQTKSMETLWQDRYDAEVNLNK